MTSMRFFKVRGGKEKKPEKIHVKQKNTNQKNQI